MSVIENAQEIDNEISENRMRKKAGRSESLRCSI